MSVQRGWRWCCSCDALFYGNAPGACPRGGGHNPTGSGYYLPFTAEASSTQGGWRWCHKCGAMYYGATSAGVCPSGGGHDATGSGQYFLMQSPIDGFAQSGWRWCRNCQVLYFHDSTMGSCPANSGGPHADDQSANYCLRYQIVGEGVACAYQGKGNSGELWLLLRQNGGFMPQVRVPGGLSCTPSLTMYQGKLWIFYQGMGNSRDLWYTTFDGIDFSQTTQVPDVRLTGQPAVTTAGDQLVIYVQGTSLSRALWRVTLTNGAWQSTDFSDGNDYYHVWNDPATVAVTSRDGTYAWAVFEQSRLRSGSYRRTGELWYMKGVGKYGGHFIGAQSSGTPGACIHNGNLYVFHEGEGMNGQLWYQAVSTGTGLDSQMVTTVTEQQITAAISGPPAPVSQGGTLSVFHEGYGNSGELWYVSSSDGVTWGADQMVPGVGVSASCGVTAFHFDP